MLLVKSGADFPRQPPPFQLNSDRELQNTADDPLKFLTLWNHVSAPTLKDENSTWRGNCDILDVFFQIVIEMCSKVGHTVVDISASTGASYRACNASGRHFIGFESDKEIYDILLRPLCESGDSTDDDDDDDSDVDPRLGVRS